MSAESADQSPATASFATLGLPEPLLRVLAELGYETPSPIQEATIPPLLAGRDMVGQAQTGTGKTAAFAFPILARLNNARFGPQALVLTPTRELAIQVAEAFYKYAKHIPGFHVLPIYGGQAYGPQLSGLRRGAHVVVGTPGRVIDHLTRGTLDLGGLTTLVLDEGDEMLRMGFIDDVELVLGKTPPACQIALFSATMPAQIRRIAKSHLKDPVEITIRNKTSTVENTRQRYWMVSGLHKLDALTRILEFEPFDAMLVFARTKVATDELAERLEARGFAAAALNGDMPQAQRERTIARLKKGELDILVATDVAARGLDVERISHVLNYDIPYDTEAYIHRIGRTGRAGRSGEAILFVTNREQHLLRSIERATRQPIEPMRLPTIADVNDQRIVRFKQKITEALASPQVAMYRDIIEQYEREQGVPAADIAAALARIAQGASPLLVPERAPERERVPEPARHERRPERPFSDDTVRYRVAVGHMHGVKPGNIVGAIANEAGIDSQYIGRVDIREDHSVIELPGGMPPDVLAHLKKVWVVGQQLQMTPEGEPFSPSVKPFAGEGKPVRSRPAKHAARAAHRPAHRAPPRPPKKPHRKGQNKGKPRPS